MKRQGTRRAGRWNRGRLAVLALAAVGAGALLLLAYSMITPEAEDVDLRPPIAFAGDSTYDVAATLAQQVGAPVLVGNRIEPLVNGDAFFPAMLDAVRSARGTIELELFAWWEGAITERFAAELSAAARRGVRVRVLLDAAGAARGDEALVEAMRASGAEVALFQPVSWLELRRVNNRDHRRSLVIDGRVAFTGGAGIGEVWTGRAQDPEHWRDTHFRIEGPAVAYLRGSFAQSWRQATGNVLGLGPPPPAAGAARIVPVLSGPEGHRSAIAVAFWVAIESARDRIRLATPYLVPEEDLLGALTGAAGRGVEVTVLVPGEHNDSSLARWAGRVIYDDLLEAGIRLHEYDPTNMHAKTMTVDGRWSVIGTANFDNRSFERNHELLLLVDDRPLAAALDRSFEDDLGRSREITREGIGEWSILARARDRLAYLLREQL